MNVFTEIIIMLLILGVLVAIHEAGHLATAKLFKVYCFEYSIGMGPAILHKKKQGHETYFSVRCIPFGGYVSMYGEAEAVKLEEGETLPPPERSLENIKKWKKCIVLFAGVFLNFILGLVLIFVSVSCFKQYYSAYSGTLISDPDTSFVFAPVSAKETDYTYGQISSKKSSEYQVNDYTLFMGLGDYTYDEENILEAYILSSDVEIRTESQVLGDYVAIYYPTNLVSSHNLLSDIKFFPRGKAVVDQKAIDLGITYLPDLESEEFAPSDGKDYFVDLSLTYAPLLADEIADEVELVDILVKVDYETVTINNTDKSGVDVVVTPIAKRNTFKQACRKWAYYVPYCCSAIVKGIITLFTPGGLSQLSGIVGMTAMVGTYSAMGGASMIFLFAGLISINLSFFNLLPFPGLDGYQIIVTIVEGITKKKVPNKVKAIVSYVGLGLLFALMIVITIKDIISLL